MSKFPANKMVVVNANIARRNKDNVYSGVNIFPMVRQVNTYHAFGGFQGANLTLTCDADTWTHITNGTNDLWTGAEANGITMTADEMVIANTGDYVGQVSVTISGLTGKDFHFRIFNVTQNEVAGYPIGVSTTGAGNNTLLSMAIYLEATAGDHFQMQVNSADGTDPVFSDAVFYVAYLHD